MKISIITSLYKCKKYLPGYLKYLLLVNNLNDCEFIFIHNQPEEDELHLINEFKSNHPEINLNHIKLDFLESLYASWNRGVMNSSGEYIAIWNVDDIRTSDSLKSQAEALDKNMNAMICYGDMHAMEKYEISSENLFEHPHYDKKKYDFLRSHYIGCFPMWRKEIHKGIGYFDEQFCLVGDYEFQIRAARSYKLIKANDILGYYLINDKNKLSSNSKLQNSERTAVELRYGVFDKINLLYIVTAIKNYQLNKCLYSNNYIKISNYFKNHKLFLLTRTPLFFGAIYRLPRNILSYIKHIILKK